MDVKLTVIEQDVKAGLLAKPVAHFSAVAAVTVDGRNLHGTGLHLDQAVAETLALADLKKEYRLAFPPIKMVVVKTLSVDFDA